MTIHLNPLAQAEMEIAAFLKDVDAAADMPRIVYPPFPPGPRLEVIQQVIMSIIKRTLEAERLMRGEHADCGAANPTGKPPLCKCACHKGHYRHFWKPVNLTPIINADGVTYHILERCKYCPDVKLKIIKAGFDKEKHTVVSLEYYIRGELRVLSKEEWLERRPEPKTGEFLRKVGL